MREGFQSVAQQPARGGDVEQRRLRDCAKQRGKSAWRENGRSGVRNRTVSQAAWRGGFFIQLRALRGYEPAGNEYPVNLRAWNGNLFDRRSVS